MSTTEQDIEKLNIENEQTTQKLNEVKDLFREIGWGLQIIRQQQREINKYFQEHPKSKIIAKSSNP